MHNFAQYNNRCNRTAGSRCDAVSASIRPLRGKHYRYSPNAACIPSPSVSIPLYVLPESSQDLRIPHLSLICCDPVSIILPQTNRLVNAVNHTCVSSVCRQQKTPVSLSKLRNSYRLIFEFRIQRPLILGHIMYHFL